MRIFFSNKQKATSNKQIFEDVPDHFLHFAFYILLFTFCCDRREHDENC